MRRIVACSVCCGLFAVGGLMAQDTNKPSESAAAPKFSTPATDPGAEWEDKGLWAGGVGIGGSLDGPRLEAMFYTAPKRGVFSEDGAENTLRAFDEKTDRFMTYAGSGARGSGIDGPFSRIRLGGWGYSSSGGMASGNSSRYRYYTSVLDGKVILRRLDFKRRVSERAPGDQNVASCEICMFEGGYFIRRGASLRKVSDDGKLIAEYTLDYNPRESFGPYDPKNDKLYGSSREGQSGWVVWGWDLKAGGKFFGVLPDSRLPESKPLRKQCATGPFKGSYFYCPAGVGFGPGDSEYRYLYMGGGDEANMYRLDLQKEVWTKLVRTADGKRWHFGDAPHSVAAWDAGGWVVWSSDGSDNMYPGYRGWGRVFERVK